MLVDKKFVPHKVNVLNLMDKYPSLKDVNMRLSILIQQVGGLFKYFVVYPTAYRNNEVLKSAYKEGEARICMMNILIQIDLFCASVGWDVDKLRYEGYQHLEDKIKEVEAKGGEII